MDVGHQYGGYTMRREITQFPSALHQNFNKVNELD